MASGGGARRAAGELKGEVLAALYAAGRPLTPAQVQGGLDDERAYTTVTTILTRLHAKGLVSRMPVGRGFAYCPAQSEAETVARQMHTLLDVGTDRAAVLAQFVDGLGPEEGRLLERLIDSRGGPGGS